MKTLVLGFLKIQCICIIHLIKLKDFRRMKIDIAHHRTPNNICTCILPYVLKIFWKGLPYESEVYFKYISNILEVYFQSIFEAYFKYTWSILQIYFKYTWSILQVYVNLMSYRRSILQVYIISTKEVHLKHILWN